MKKYMILGCGGYVGSHILDMLLGDPENSVQIHGWDLQNTKVSHHLADTRFIFNKKPIQESWNDPEFEAVLMKSDAVIHMAAICNPSHYNKKAISVIQSSFIDVYPVADLCAKHNKWFVFFSTSEIYGRTLSSHIGDKEYKIPEHYILNENKTPLVMGPIQNDRWSYACAKQLMERYIYGLNKESGMPYTIIRPLNFFGSRMDYIPGYDGEGVPRVLACFMDALMHNRPMQLVDGGHAYRVITDIGDAIKAISLILNNPEKSQNEIFNIGNAENEITIRELALKMRKIYARLTGGRSEDHTIEEISSLDFYGQGYEDCDRRLPDLSNVETKLGWKASKLLDDILYDTMRYIHTHYREARKLKAVGIV